VSPILGIVASQISGHLYAASFESIATVTLGSSQTQIEFASIPTTYQHLHLRISGRSTGAYTYSSVYLRLNNDTGNNYTYHALLGDGSSAQSYGRGLAGDNCVVAQNISGATSVTNNFGSVIVDILDYANTNKYKTTRSFGGYDNNGSGTPIGTINLNSSLWNNTSAITNIKLFTDGDFAANTKVALYGIKDVA
jgi:hypothetical protein